MGNLFTNPSNNSNESIHKKGLIAGLKSSGKTTILENLGFEDQVIQYANFSFDIKRNKYEKFYLNIWELKEGTNVRSLWGPYFYDSSVLIFVVDSNDTSKIEEAHDELHRVFNQDEFENAVLLVFANKQDLPNSKNLDFISQKLDLNSVNDRQWKIFGSSATSGDGICEGINWVIEQINQTI